MEPSQRFNQEKYEALYFRWRNEGIYTPEGIQALKDLMKYLASCGESHENADSHLHVLSIDLWEQLGRDRQEMAIPAITRNHNLVNVLISNVPSTKTHKRVRNEKKMYMAQVEDLATMPESMLARL